MKRLLLPVNSRRRKYVSAVADKLFDRTTATYERWADDRNHLIKLYEKSKTPKTPQMSIVVPAFNTPQRYLEPFVRSVIGQTYQNWELVIVDASSDKDASYRIKACLQLDKRIKLVKTDNNGISHNTNIGIEASQGDYIGFMDHDDVLEHNALEEVARVINEAPGVGLIYSDEDKLSENGGKFLDPHFKPGWSPHLLAHVNYITHFVVVRKDLIEKAGYLDPDKDGAQDYDFLLRLTDLDIAICHIPQVLYHWRVAESSTAANISNKPYVLKAGERALKDHFKRREIQATATAIKNMPGFYRVIYKPAHKPTIVITPFANPSLIRKYMSVLKATGMLDGYQVIAPYNMEGFEIVDADNLKEYMERSSELAGDAMVILNDFVFPEEGSWASNLSGVLNDERVFAVSPAIVKADKTVLDMGLVKQAQETTLLFCGTEFGKPTPFGNTAWPRDVDELTGSVLAVRTKDFKRSLKKKNPLTEYSASNPEDTFNVVWANTLMTHVKVPLAKNETKYFNANIHKYDDRMHLYANDQQIMDALIARDLESNANE